MVLYIYVDAQAKKTHIVFRQYNFIHSTHGHGVCEKIDCGLEDFSDIKSHLMFSHNFLPDVTQMLMNS